MIKPFAIALAIVVGLGLIAQIVTQNVGGGWTGAYKDGEVHVPGKGEVRLPAGDLDISLRALGSAVHVPARLGVTVASGEGRPLALTRAVGPSFGPADRTADVTYKRIWKTDVTSAGEYRVTARGARSDRGLAVTFGRSPTAEAGTIWKITGIAALAVVLAFLGSLAMKPRRAAAT